MSWNHRVIRASDPNGEYLYGVHEVMYDVDGKPTSSTHRPVAPHQASLAELEKELKRMLASCNKPVLEWVNNELVEVE